MRAKMVTGLKNGIAALIVLLIFLFCNVGTAVAVPKIKITDDLGRTVNLQHPAVKIVCLSEAHAENIVALRAVSQLAGVVFSTDPKWVSNKVRRLSKNPTTAQILELKPDLVLANMQWARGNLGIIKELDRLKTPCAILDIPKWAEFAEYLETLGVLTGRSREADHALAQAEKTLSKAKVRSDKSAQPRVLVLDGTGFATAEPFSWGAHLVTATGAKLVSRKTNESMENVPWLVYYGPKRFAEDGANIDVVITLTNGVRGVPALSRQDILNDKRFSKVPAVKNGRVYEMREADLMLPSLVRLDSSLKKCASFISGK